MARSPDQHSTREKTQRESVLPIVEYRSPQHEVDMIPGTKRRTPWDSETSLDEAVDHASEIGTQREDEGIHTSPLGCGAESAQEQRSGQAPQSAAVSDQPPSANFAT